MVLLELIQMHECGCGRGRFSWVRFFILPSAFQSSLGQFAPLLTNGRVSTNKLGQEWVWRKEDPAWTQELCGKWGKNVSSSGHLNPSNCANNNNNKGRVWGRRRTKKSSSVDTTYLHTVSYGRMFRKQHSICQFIFRSSNNYPFIIIPHQLNDGVRLCLLLGEISIMMMESFDSSDEMRVSFLLYCHLHLLPLLLLLHGAEANGQHKIRINSQRVLRLYSVLLSFVPRVRDLFSAFAQYNRHIWP